ncbi:MAG: carbon-nitrogen hydrolase family protein [Candidatus Syntropharchaeia archaeon]
MSEIKAALIQMRVGNSFETNLKEAERWIEHAASKGAEIISLPEYFFAPNERMKIEELYSLTHQKTIDFLADISQDCRIVVAGCVIERSDDSFFNTCLVYENGKCIGKQRKVHPTDGECEWGIKNFDRFNVIKSKKGTLGVLVCADVLHPEAGRILGLLGAEIVFVPVISRFYEEDLTKNARNCIFVARAYDNGYFLLKTGGVGVSPFGYRTVGRSLVASPWGIIAQPEDENKPQVIFSQLDMDLLRKIKRETNFGSKRVKKAYLPLVQ